MIKTVIVLKELIGECWVPLRNEVSLPTFTVARLSNIAGCIAKFDILDFLSKCFSSLTFPHTPVSAFINLINHTSWQIVKSLTCSSMTWQLSKTSIFKLHIQTTIPLYIKILIDKSNQFGSLIFIPPVAQDVKHSFCAFGRSDSFFFFVMVKKNVALKKIFFTKSF